MQRCSCHKTIHFLFLSSQISSDIIKRCVAQLSLDDIFDGFVERSRKALEESICCCQAWKDTYSHLSGVHNKHSPEEWVLDESSIFAHIDAFIQRCKDLLEVVEGQVSILVVVFHYEWPCFFSVCVNVMCLWPLSGEIIFIKESHTIIIA